MLRTFVSYLFFFTILATGYSQYTITENDSFEFTPRSVSSQAVATVDCSLRIPSGTFVVRESLFKNYDYAVNAAARLRSNGFPNTRIIHTSCQACDVKGDFYLVVMSPVLQSKEQAHAFIYRAYEIAARTGGVIKLHNARIVATE